MKPSLSWKHGMTDTECAPIQKVETAGIRRQQARVGGNRKQYYNIVEDSWCPVKVRDNRSLEQQIKFALSAADLPLAYTDHEEYFAYEMRDQCNAVATSLHTRSPFGPKENGVRSEVSLR
jgi:hypothetical protein